MGVVEFKEETLSELCGEKEDDIVETLERMGFPSWRENGSIMVEVTPNRPDLYTLFGVVRSVRMYLEKDTPTKYKTEGCAGKIIVDRSVEKVRPFISAAAVYGVEMNEERLESIIQAQEKLHETYGRKRKKVAIGMHNMDKIEFPLEYVCVETERFIPLDMDKEMEVGEIVKLHPKGVEYSHLLKKGRYPIIREKKSGRVVSFPPIINAERTRVKNDTRNILIEVTGTHRESVESVLNILSCDLHDMGGSVRRIEINGTEYPNLKRKEVCIREEEINRILGECMSSKEIGESLKKMDIIYSSGEEAKIPPYRTDIFSESDIIEDVAIGRGYDKFVPEEPKMHFPGSKSRRTRVKEKIREIMNGMGFMEAVSTVLVREDMIEHPEKSTRIANAVSTECEYVRDGLFWSMMRIFSLNRMKGVPQKIYEIGEYYIEGREKLGVCAGIMGKEADFNMIRSVIQRLFKEMNLKIEINKGKDERFSERFGVFEKGKIGEVSKDILKKMGVEFPIAYFEAELFDFGKP